MSVVAIYLYGLAARGILGALDLEGVEEGSKVTVVGCGRFDAIVSSVPRAEYEAARDDTEPADPSWVIPRALRHDQVVREVAARAPVLPARFGAVFTDEQSLSELVELHGDEIQTYLGVIDGKAEWSMRAWIVPDEAAERLLAADPLLAARWAKLPAGQGVRYFAEKRLREEARTKARRLALEAARSVRERLREMAPTRELPFRRPEADGREMVLNLVCLLEHPSADELLERARAAAISTGTPGLDIQILGPWPAFHFCPELTTAVTVL